MGIQTSSLLHFLKHSSSCYRSKGSLLPCLSHKWAGGRKERVSMIKAHFPLNEAGWGPGQPAGSPDQLPRPQQEASGKAQGEGWSSRSVDRLCLCPEQPAAWPTHDYRSSGTAFHGSTGAARSREPPADIQAWAHSNL